MNTSPRALTILRKAVQDLNLADAVLEPALERDMSRVQMGIADWQIMTFGDPPGIVKAMHEKLLGEQKEFAMALFLADYKASAQVADEGADLFILLLGMFERLGIDAYGAIEAKMAINRARQWPPAIVNGMAVPVQHIPTEAQP